MATEKFRTGWYTKLYNDQMKEQDSLVASGRASSPFMETAFRHIVESVKLFGLPCYIDVVRDKHTGHVSYKYYGKDLAEGDTCAKLIDDIEQDAQGYILELIGKVPPAVTCIDAFGCRYGETPKRHTRATRKLFNLFSTRTPFPETVRVRDGNRKPVVSQYTLDSIRRSKDTELYACWEYSSDGLYLRNCEDLIPGTKLEVQ